MDMWKSISWKSMIYSFHWAGGGSITSNHVSFIHISLSPTVDLPLYLSLLSPLV